MWRTLCKSIHGRLGRQALERAFAAEAAPARDDGLAEVLAEQLRQVRVAGTFKQELQLTTPQGASVGELTRLIEDDLCPACLCWAT